MDIIFVVAASFIVFIALLIIAIRCINISFNADMPSGRLLTRTELRRLYDDLNTNDFLTTPVLYINIFSHRLQTEDVYGQSSRANVYLEECVKNAVHSAGFLGACAIDGHNFVLLASRDNKHLERFALEFAATHDLPTTLRRIINMLDIHIGQYTPVNSEVSFDDAVDHARRASLHARNIDSRFAIGRYELLQNVYDNEEMKKNLEQFIDDNRFFTVLQPYVSVSDGRIMGAETLTRLRMSADMPATMPGKFLAAINSEHLYEKFDFYVFNKCCEWISCRRDRFEDLPPISCNFSRVTLSAGNFAERFFETTEKYGIRPSQLIIEVNEEVPETSVDVMLRNINLLFAAGFPIYLDDFGIGTTSISDLKRMKISVVKMDRSLVTDLNLEKNKIIFKSLVDMAHSLDMKVLCEGIENEEQKKYAVEMGADIIQGFYFYRPIGVVEYDEILEGRPENDGEEKPR